MSAFVERLVEAAKHAGVEPTQAGIAESLGLSKQTVWRWFREGIEPNAENCFEIARKWGVDAEWLKSGPGPVRCACAGTNRPHRQARAGAGAAEPHASPPRDI